MKLPSICVEGLVILLILTLVTVCHSLFKYDIHVDHFERPDRDTLFDFKTLRVKKYNRTTYTLDGYFELLMPFSNEILGVVDVYGYTGNNYLRIFHFNITKMCHFLQTDQLVMSKVLNQTSLGLRPKCPLPPGNIHCYNTVFPTDHIVPLHYLRFRKIKLDVHYYIGGDFVSAFAAYVIIDKFLV